MPACFNRNGTEPAASAPSSRQSPPAQDVPSPEAPSLGWKGVKDEKLLKEICYYANHFMEAEGEWNKTIDNDDQVWTAMEQFKHFCAMHPQDADSIKQVWEHLCLWMECIAFKRVKDNASLLKCVADAAAANGVKMPACLNNAHKQMIADQNKKCARVLKF